MANRSSRRRRTTADVYGGDNLSRLMNVGVRQRRHKYFLDARSFALTCLMAIGAQTLVYVALNARSTEPRWMAVTIVCLVLTGVPLLSAFTLTAFRRTEAPIVTAVVITAIYFSFAVTVLSALRVPVSYLGLVVAFPVIGAIMSLGNIRFQSAISSRVALLGFRNDDAIRHLLRDIELTPITDPGADISDFDLVLIDPASHHSEKWAGLLTRCYVGGVEIMAWSKFLEIRLGRVDIAQFDLSRLKYSPSQVLYARLKRLLDLVIIIVTLPVTMVLAAGVALYILVRDGWPVIFIQHRRGLGGHPFRLYKFRTMRQDKGRGKGALSTGIRDSRIIAGCRFIRLSRLDELPQLFNVLIGDMALIGPRPTAVPDARTSEAIEPKYGLRTLVLPGITGWAQVNSGYASSTDEEINKLAYDLYYIKHLSLDLDLQILFRTVRTMLLGLGAR